MTELEHTSGAVRLRARGTEFRAGESQPRSLWDLAFTELWERFSFYGLQAILTFYLLYSLGEGGLDLGPATAVSIAGVYGGAVYISQTFGAWVADRLVSPRRMVLYGAVIITMGHLALALLSGLSGLMVGLGLIVVGTGALKTNITTIVGMLYANGRTGRDAGFSYFYLTITIGSIFGPLATGFTQSRWGFHLAFGLAAVGMVFALAQYARRMRYLPDESNIVANPLRWNVFGTFSFVVGAATVGAIFTALWKFGIVNSKNLTYTVAVVILIVASTYFAIMLRSQRTTRIEKRRIVGFLPLWMLSFLYFGFLFQKITTISIFIKERVSLDLGGWKIPAAWLLTASPIAGAICMTLCARLWSKLGSWQPSASVKIAVGLLVIGTAYLTLTFSALYPGKTVPPVFVLFCMAIAGSSEAFVGPIGLALATRVAPTHFATQTVALVLLTLGGGSAVAGLLGILFTAIPTTAYFVLVGTVALVLGLTLLLFARAIDKLLSSS